MPNRARAETELLAQLAYYGRFWRGFSLRDIGRWLAIEPRTAGRYIKAVELGAIPWPPAHLAKYAAIRTEHHPTLPGERCPNCGVPLPVRRPPKPGRGVWANPYAAARVRASIASRAATNLARQARRARARANELRGGVGT